MKFPSGIPSREAKSQPQVQRCRVGQRACMCVVRAPVGGDAARHMGSRECRARACGATIVIVIVIACVISIDRGVRDSAVSEAVQVEVYRVKKKV